MEIHKLGLLVSVLATVCILQLAFNTVSADSEESLVSQYPKEATAEEPFHSRIRRSLRMNRAWTRTGYGVVFVYSSAFTAYEISQIKAAANEIRKHSCFPITLLSQYAFWNGYNKKYPNYVFINKNSAVGCGQAFVGMRGGYQSLTLSPDYRCFTIGTIMHEMMHTLGIEHEQSRPDRNQFIQINNPNVQTGLHNVFNIAYGSTAYGPYDFDSVMHYGRYAFSAYGNSPTLVSRVPGRFVPFGQGNHLTQWDKKKINVMTGCKVSS